MELVDQSNNQVNLTPMNAARFCFKKRCCVIVMVPKRKHYLLFGSIVVQSVCRDSRLASWPLRIPDATVDALLAASMTS